MPINNNIMIRCFKIILLCLQIVILYLVKVRYCRDNFSGRKKIDINSKILVCEGRRDGVSGCRDCCATLESYLYNPCVSHCMRV